MEKDFEFSFRRGDTFPFKVKIKTKDDAVIAKEDISTLFATCRRLPSESSPILFQKTLSDVEISDNYIHIVLNPEDTEGLHYGIYCLDIEVTISNGIKKTKFGTFELEKETSIAAKAGE